MLVIITIIFLTKFLRVVPQLTLICRCLMQKKMRHRLCVSNLCCTPVGHSGHFWACIRSCTGRSGLLQYKRRILQDTARNTSLQNGRSPQDRLPGTDSETGIWVHPTCLGWNGEKKRWGLSWEGEADEKHRHADRHTPTDGGLRVI